MQYNEWDTLYQRVRAFVGSRLHDDVVADDVTQEVFVAAAQVIQDRAPINNLTAWLITTAKRRVIDAYRRHGRQPRTVPPDDQAMNDDGQAGDELPLTGCVRGCLRQLGERDGTVLSAVYLDGHSQAEVAKILGLSAPGARSAVQRARQRLADHMFACCGITSAHDEGCNDDCPCHEDSDIRPLA